MNTPTTLDRAGIAARIPHRGRMCLLDNLDGWSTDEIRCRTASHRDLANPLRLGGSLPAAAAVEYAAQAMALHGGLGAPADTPPTAGFLASVRGVRLLVERLDTVAGDLHVYARRLLGDAGQAQYQFALRDGSGALLVEGRATVVLDRLP
ncbi:3-hydroxydecanoyl-(acyl-carrier-protein) dehydratase, inferred for ABFAE pathway [Rubrivivax sp. A210]|uniref:hydroxymyristoyl-ACP dehydratase n=1 Tax=Rubrivivax sp. A210 TaxID=2772301 RepID=UPI001917B210|nr:hydroxymyristoyl-ACP dehydratase [Rubrivivax sp. A210]CAD5372054.1 3-hydroxydecanoyl-(acyl-carrier-protein) dehydratase, inferred for ABFAE pathway [Rubrivivax sp. A210]